MLKKKETSSTAMAFLSKGVNIKDRKQVYDDAIKRTTTTPMDSEKNQ